MCLAWLDQDEAVNEAFEKSKSARKTKKKVDVIVPRPVTRSQKDKNNLMSVDGSSTQSPGRARKSKSRSK